MTYLVIPFIWNEIWNGILCQNHNLKKFQLEYKSLFFKFKSPLENVIVLLSKNYT
jgi:hypothetical protein